MANTKVTEKECTLSLCEPRKCNGVGWKAWPLELSVPLVNSRSPFDVTVAVSSKLILVPVKPRYRSWLSGVDAVKSAGSWPMKRRRQSRKNFR